MHVYMTYSYSVLKGVDCTCINYCFSFAAWHKCSVYPGHLNPAADMNDVKDLLAAEKQVTFEIDDFTIIKGLTLLIAAYYVFCKISGVIF